jgi:hypothetical protein
VAAKTNTGPGGAPRKGKPDGRTTAPGKGGRATPATGRVTPKGTRPGQRIGRPSTPEESGRYTKPIPRSVRKSAPWYGPVVLLLLVLGVAVIVVNYIVHIPGVSHGSPWGLVAGIVMIFVGFLMATSYH